MLPKEENLRNIARLKEQYGDGQCYLPCIKWKGLQRRRIVRESNYKILLGFWALWRGKQISPIGKLFIICFIIIVKRSIILILDIYTKYILLFVIKKIKNPMLELRKDVPKLNYSRNIGE